MSDQEFEAAQDVVEPDAVEQDTPEPEQDTPDAAPVKSWSDEDESEAQLFGWKSPDKWQGDKPDGYIDNPKEFLDRVQRSRIFQTMQEKMTEQERKLAVVNDKALERQKQEYQRELDSITKRQRKAVEEADTDAWDTLEREKQDMLKKAPSDAPEQPVEPPKVVKEFQEANDWAKDPVLWREAIQAVNVGLEMGLVQGSDAEGQLKFAQDRMFAKYPHLKPQRTKAAPRQMVDGGGLGGGSATGRGAFEKLPADAKATFQRQMLKGIWTEKDKEEYAREYNNA